MQEFFCTTLYTRSTVKSLSLDFRVEQISVLRPVCLKDQDHWDPVHRYRHSHMWKMWPGLAFKWIANRCRHRSVADLS